MAEISKVSSADFLTAQTSNKTKKANNDFGNIFSDKKSTVSNDTNSNTKENTKTKDTKDTSQTEKPVDSTETKKPEGKVEDKKTEEVKEVVETTEKQITAEASSEIPAEVIALICSMFNVSEEEALAMMDELGITEDMLFDISEVTKLLVAVNELEDASELLDLDGVKEFIQEFKNIVEEAKTTTVDNKTEEPKVVVTEQVKTEAVEVVATTEVKQSTVTVATTEEATNVNNEVVEEVQPQQEQQKGEFNSNQQSDMQMGDEPSIAQPVQINVLDQQIQFQEIVERANIPSNIDTEDVISQLVDNMKVEIKSDTSEVKIHLKPEHLGDVTLKILTQNGIVTAQFVAENERIKAIIEANFQDLSETLRQQGFDIGDLSASVSDGNNNEDGYQSSQSGSTIKLDDELVEEVVEETSYYQDADDVGSSRHNYTA